MKILSVDIGIKNLGYTVLQYETTVDDSLLSFGLINISSGKKDVVESRCKSIFDFIGRIEPNVLIVERQVHENTQAMCLMYSIVTAGVGMGADVIIFDPKLKFTALKIPFCVKNKMHKKLSIEMAQSLLSHIAPDLLPEFGKFTKKDDIADSLIQLYVHLAVNKVYRFVDPKTLRDLTGQ
jgi:Holliday junction resolvasome RuvABC endonuclease subunit